MTSTDRLEAALNALIEDGKKTAAAKMVEAEPVDLVPADVESSD